MKVTAIVQARMSSKRLPGKVLSEIEGITIIELIFRRLKQCKRIDNLVLATSENAEDDVLVAKANEVGIKVSRGELDNVLSRVLKAAHEYESDYFVRITGDCPLIDPHLVDCVIADHIKSEADYTSNALDPSFPDGMDTEVISREALYGLKGKSLSSADCEHVTFYIYSHPEEYTLNSYAQESNFSHIRLTVDEPDDLVFIKKVIKDINIPAEDLSLNTMTQFLSLQNDDYFLNSSIKRNEGLARSIDNKERQDESI